MSRLVEFLATATVAVVLLAGAAHADSRLFSARSDQNGITIVGASLNGEKLSVAGQGGGVTFFRIDNPGGSVSCTNHIAFTGSNGMVATIDADICASGSQVTVPFSTAAAPTPPAPPVAKQVVPATPAPPAVAAPPSAVPPATGGQPATAGQPPGVQPVTISVDDPNVTIDGVFMGGKPVAINRRIGNSVEVLVAPGAEGVNCSRDLGLVLSDGRRIARAVDICANNRRVAVTLLASGGTPTTTAPPPPSPPTAGEPPPPATAGGPPPAATADVWMFSSTSDNGSLAFAVPNSEDSEFTAVCAPASNEMTLALGRSAPEVKPGATVTVGLSAGAFSRTYQATGSDVSQESGLSNPLIKLKTDDPLWPAIIGGSALTIQIGSAAPYSLSLKGSGAKARQFLAFCSPAPAVVPAPPVVGVPPMPSPGAGAIPFACDDGSFISVVFDDANAAVIVTEGGGGLPMSLRRVPSRQGARYVGNGDELVGYAETITWSRGGSYPATCRPR